MLRESTVFGPIHSRRLGESLGINLLPSTGKLCNFDCIYCECGWNADGKTTEPLPSRAVVRAALEDKLSECLLSGTKIDSITFSGTGEPTLNPDFPGIIEDTIELRDIYYPGAVVSVLTNATRISAPGVFEALLKVDKPILKLDAPTNSLAAVINRPAGGYDVDSVVGQMSRFDGEFVLQTMFLRCCGFDSASAESLEAWKGIVRRLRPKEIMVYTVDRPAPDASIVKMGREEMHSLVEDLIEEGFNIQIKG